jgi:hypothetical protein
MISKAVTDNLPFRGIDPSGELEEINSISLSFDNGRSMEKLCIQVFASEPNFSRFIPPK